MQGIEKPASQRPSCFGTYKVDTGFPYGLLRLGRTWEIDGFF